MNTIAPAIFISHGSPELAIMDGPAHKFLKTAGRYFRTPKAIILVSAHHIGAGLEISYGNAPKTLYDFGDFPGELRNISYPASGSPKLSKRIYGKLKDLGMSPSFDFERGFDHGAWVPLHLMYPEADIPVVQVSINIQESSRWHVQLGLALSEFRMDNIAVIGSGGLTHNLRESFPSDPKGQSVPPDWVTQFASFVTDALLEGRYDEVVNALEVAPKSKQNHPTPDHFLPLMVALGAGGPVPKVTHLHSSFTDQVLAMDCFSFV